MPSMVSLLALMLLSVPAVASEPVAGPPAPPPGIRGGAFEVGGTGGVAVWDAGLGLEPCAWFGGFAGHRFQPLADRFHFGFRAGWEGCVTDQKVTSDRVDMILIDIGFTYGIKPVDWLIVYGLTGGGFLIADTTPSGGKPFPRMAFQGGGGVAAAFGYFYVDASVRVMAFENIQFGGFGGTTGTVGSPVITLSVGAHI